MCVAAQAPRSRCRVRGGLAVWLAGALLVGAAALTLGWMVVLPGVVQARFASATGSRLGLHGLAGDPFAGRATVGGWTLRASDAPDAPVLARGGASSVIASGWRAAFSTEIDAPVRIDLLELDVTEAFLAPGPDGAWPLLAVGASAGLPYEKGGAVGEVARVSIGRLVLRVDTVIVRDARTGRDTPVRIAWRGEFHDLDHSRPVLVALLAAVRAAGAK